LTTVTILGGGAGGGGGGTYLLAIAEELARGGERGISWSMTAQPPLACTLEGCVPRGVRVIEQPRQAPAARLLREQLSLRAQEPTDVLVAAGNFTPLLRRAPCVLIAQNALHFTPVGYGGRQGARIRVEGALARASIRHARATVTPTQAMADLIEQRTGRRAVALHFGPALAARRESGSGPFVFAHRTPWGPHKNLATLLEATHLLTRTHAGKFVVRTSCDPCSPFARTFRSSQRERAFLELPAVRSHVEVMGFELGSAEHRTVRGDAVVMPSTVESFCFPLAEAAALGLPVAAADTDFAREICGRAAFFCAPGNAVSLCAAMRRLVDGDRPPSPEPDTVTKISWSRHVDLLADLCQEIADRAPARRSATV